ncbi:MAG: serine/threonine-protein kinase [Polyangiaceae bacterium]
MSKGLTTPTPRRHDEDPHRDSTPSRSSLRSTSRPWHYELIGQIASGGMASVHLALQKGGGDFGRHVAIKQVHPHLSHNRNFCEMFVDEARIAARINHPNVCRVLDFGERNGGHFIALEYLAGEPLSRVLRKLKAVPELKNSPLRPLLIARLMVGFAEGLHAAHSLLDDFGNPLDVVHRDVTPQNLFVLYDGTVRVTDFGIAHARQRLHKTEGEFLKGKLSYMAPEQIERRPIDRRADSVVARRRFLGGAHRTAPVHGWQRRRHADERDDAPDRAAVERRRPHSARARRHRAQAFCAAIAASATPRRATWCATWKTTWRPPRRR